MRWVGLQWLLPSYKTNCDVLEIPIGKYFTIQRVFFFFFCYHICKFKRIIPDFIIETLIIRNELRASVVKRNFTQKCKDTLASFMQAWGHRLRMLLLLEGPQRILVYIQVSWGPQRWKTSWPHTAVHVDSILENKKNVPGHLNVKTCSLPIRRRFENPYSSP